MTFGDIYGLGVVISAVLFMILLIVYGLTSKSFNVDEDFVSGAGIGLCFAVLLWFVFWPAVIYFYVRYKILGEENNNEHR